MDKQVFGNLEEGLVIILTDEQIESLRIMGQMELSFDNTKPHIVIKKEVRRKSQILEKKTKEEPGRFLHDYPEEGEPR
jgi:hypothetical protein